MMNKTPESYVPPGYPSSQQRLGEAPGLGFLQRIGEIRNGDPIPPRDFRNGERKLREVTMPRQGIQDHGQILPRLLGVQALGNPLSRRHPRGFGLGKPVLGWRHHEQTYHDQSSAQHASHGRPENERAIGRTPQEADYRESASHDPLAWD